MRDSKVDDKAKIRSRRDSVSPSGRKVDSSNYRDRSRDRSYDRSSIVSNGNQTRIEDPRNTRQTDEESKNDSKDLKNEEERGRTTDRKSDSKEALTADDGQQDMMMQLMGFGSFDSTKGKHVAGVGSGGAKKNKRAHFRQYMNRDKGFNRNLSPERRKKK